MLLAPRSSVLFVLAFVGAFAGCATPAATVPDAAPAAPASPAPQPQPQPASPASSPALDALPSLPGAVTATPPPAPVAPTAPYTFVTALQGNALEHPRLDITPGATVTWKNLDLTVHSVIGEPGGFIGSGPIPPGGEFSQTFERAGVYAFHCRYHAGMAGLIVVA